ncbi:MAG: ATP-grasp domain-containing protein, partial [Planctomyces sp.]
MKAGLVPFCVDYFGDDDLLECLSEAGERQIAGNGDPELRSFPHHKDHFDTRSETFTSELFRRIQSPEDLENAISTVPASVPLVWCGGFENSIDIIERIRRHRPVFGAAASSVQLARNPRVLSDWCHSAYIRFPQTYCFDDFRDDERTPGRIVTADGSKETAEPNLSTDSIPHQWLLKSSKSAGGLGVSRWESSVSEFLQTRRQDQYLQQQIHGQPFSAVFCTDHDGTVLLGCSLLLSGWECAGAPPFHYSGNYGPISLPNEAAQKVIHAGRMIAERSGLRGVFGIDFVLQDTVPWLIEVNPRLTASHELFDRAYGGCLLLDHLRCFTAEIESSEELSRKISEMAELRSMGTTWGSACDSSGQIRQSTDSGVGRTLFRLILYSKRLFSAEDCRSLILEIQKHWRQQSEILVRSVNPMASKRQDE